MFSDKTKELIEETKSKLLSAPIDTAADAVAYQSEASDLPEDVRAKLRDFADRLQPAVKTLEEVEQDFLEIFPWVEP
jgi:hypothetical protein